MHMKTGRNDPCPCGSGKKYKHCHGLQELAPPAALAPSLPDDAHDAHDGATTLAIDWLTERHRKGFKTALDSLLDDLWHEDAPRKNRHLDAEVLSALQINLTEWLLAEGDIQVKGECVSINQLLVGPDGPRLTAGQRAWLAQMAQRPLLLYTVTDVRRGQGMTLCDAIDAQAAPVEVQERAGSQSAHPGLLIGVRVVQRASHAELSGAIYPFSMLAQPAVLAAVRAVNSSGLHPANLTRLRSQAIARAWIRQFVLPPEMPRIVDASSGDPLLLITDHYRVLDGAALAQALAGCADVSGDAGAGWSLLQPLADGGQRVLAAINPGKRSHRIEVFCRTQALADAGRAWLQRVAGSAVLHLTREITDPHAGVAAAQHQSRAPAARSGLPPEQLSAVIEQAIRRTYARWADEPIPLLDGQTPRQAMGTAAGLERVKGLLRSYESGEADQAAQAGRPAVSFQFLWDALELAR